MSSVLDMYRVPFIWKLTNAQYRYGCAPKQLEFPFMDDPKIFGLKPNPRTSAQLAWLNSLTEPCAIME